MLINHPLVIPSLLTMRIRLRVKLTDSKEIPREARHVFIEGGKVTQHRYYVVTAVEIFGMFNISVHSSQVEIVSE